jgi:hypothetical protein
MEPSTRWISTANENFVKHGSGTMVKNQKSTNRAIVELAYGPSTLRATPLVIHLTSCSPHRGSKLFLYTKDFFQPTANEISRKSN